MDITDKLDKVLKEATVPSQSGIITALNKGLDKDRAIFNLGIELHHYFNLKFIKDGYIFQSKPNIKTLSDELWYRLGRNLEKSEFFHEKAMSKLKDNFYKIVNKWSKVYKFDKKENRWEFIG